MTRPERVRLRLRTWLGVLLFAGIAVPYAACDEEHITINDAVRARSTGLYAQLSDGMTHYDVRGPESGRRVVLVHGASGPMAVWDPTVGPLATAGHHVLRYDLFGRGLSDRRRVTYDLALFERQLEELLGATGNGGPVDVVGSSMGAIVASRFAVLHPDRVRKVVLIGPAGFPIETAPIAKLIEVPVVGDWAMAVFGDRTLAEHHRRYYAAPEKFPEAGQAFREQLEYRGYKAAILSTMRHMPMNDFKDGYRALGALGKPVLLLWGREDRTFPFSNMPEAKDLVCPRGCDAVAVDGAGHLPQYERPDVVNPRIVEFLAP